jgi:hypothetical protein
VQWFENNSPHQHPQNPTVGLHPPPPPSIPWHVMCNMSYRYTQQLAQQGLSILLAAWNVSQMAPASMMSSMISVQVHTASVVFHHALTTAVRCLLPLPKHVRQSGGALTPSNYSTKPVLFASHCPSRSSLFSNYSIMVSGAVSVQPPLGDIPCYFRLSAQVNAAVEQSPPHQPRVLIKSRCISSQVTTPNWLQLCLKSSATCCCRRRRLHLFRGLCKVTRPDVCAAARASAFRLWRCG